MSLLTLFNPTPSTLTVEVREGGTLRATRTFTPGIGAGADFTLTTTERDSITTWANVELWLTATGGSRAVRVRRAQGFTPIGVLTGAGAISLALTAQGTATTALAAVGSVPLGLTVQGTADAALAAAGSIPLALAVAGTATHPVTAAGAISFSLSIAGVSPANSTLTVELREGGVLRATRTYIPDGTRNTIALTQGERDSVLVWADAELWLVATDGARAVRVRRAAFVTPSTLTLEAREGGVVRASRTWTPTGARETVTLTPAEQASITSWTALEWWLTATGGSRAIRIRRARGMVVVAGTPSTLTLELREGGVLRATRDIVPDDPPAEDPDGTATRWVFEFTEAEFASVGTWANLEAWLIAGGGTRPIRVTRWRMYTPLSPRMATGTVPLTLAVAGTATHPVTATGALTFVLTVQGTATSPVTASGGVTLGFSVAGAAGAALAATGAVAMTLAATGTATLQVTAVGAVAMAVGVAGTVTVSTPVAAAFGVAVESRQAVTAALTSATEALLRVTATRLPASESRGRVVAARSPAAESRGGVTTTASPTAETRGRVVASWTPAAETLLLVTAAPTVPLETLLGLVAARLPASEWRGRVVATAVVPVESRGFALVLQTFAVPVESLGRVVAALEVEAESLQPVAGAWTAAIETLLEVVAAPSPGSESRGSVVAARLPATEWRQRVVATAVVPVESLALSGVVQAFAIPTEWRSWVASLHSPEAESKQPVAMSAVLAAEHRLRVARALTADVEARGGVRATYLVPVESWGVVVALLIRLLDVRLGVSVLEEVALTPGVATLAALRPSVLDALTWGVAEADDAALDVPTLADLAMATP